MRGLHHRFLLWHLTFLTGIALGSLATAPPAHAQQGFCSTYPPLQGTGIVLVCAPQKQQQIVVPTLSVAFVQQFVLERAHSSASTVSLTCAGDGTVVTNCSIVGPTSVTVGGSPSPGTEDTITVTYATGAAPGFGSLTLTTSLVPGQNSGKINVATTGTPAIAVLAAVGAENVAPNGTGTAAFTVTNNGTYTDSIVATPTCSGTGIQANSCTVAQPRFALAAGASQTVSVTFTGSATVGTTGTVQLTAGFGGFPGPDSAAYKESGSTAVTVWSPGLAIAGVAAFPTIDRGACLEIQAAPAIASECGDARVVHPLPTIRTYNKSRTPILLYSWEHAWPFLVFPAHLTMPTTGSLPDTVHGHTYFRPSGTSQAFTNGIDGLSTWLGSQWVLGATRQIVMPGTMFSDSTGLYDYRIITTRIYNSANTTLQDTVQGQFILVNRESSYFGAGWWLAGLERLIAYGSGVKAKYAWIGGDGSTQLYTACNGTSTTYACPARYLTSRDSIQILAGGAGYDRLVAHGVKVWFDATGLHDSTTDRLGHVTHFSYDTQNRLTSIAVPAPTGPLTAYTFAYGTDGVVSTVTTPAPTSGGATRTVALTSGAHTGSNSPTSTVLTAITDPDGFSTSFTYDSVSLGRMTSRTDRRGTVTTLGWDGSALLYSASIAMGGSTPNIVRMFSNGQGQGLGVSSVADATAAIPDSAYTTYFGPRANLGSDSADVTRFWLDSLNQVTRVRDAHGYEALLGRSNTTYAGAVTRVQYANGRVVVANYDGRGNDTSSTDSSFVIGGVAATTRYEFDPVWNFVTVIDPPLHDSTIIAYDGNGNRAYQQDGRGAASRTTFRYNNPYLLVSKVTQPQATTSDTTTAADSVEYDATLGNVSATQSPRHFWTTYGTDAVGRTINSTAAFFAGDTTKPAAHPSTQSTVYDLMDRVTQTLSIGPTTAPNQGELQVNTSYDTLFAPTAVTRTASGGTAITTKSEYDPAGRLVAATASDGNKDSTVYDVSGNAIKEWTRRGDIILSVYDALNRPVRRIIPARADTSWQLGLALNDPDFPHGNPNFTLDTAYDGRAFPADTILWTYDALGRITEADNADARVSRTYLANSLLNTETQAVRTIATIANGGNFTQHQYTISYGYDLDSRRVSLTHPPQLLPSTGVLTTAVETYRYDPATGDLTTVVDPLGAQFTLSYDYRHRPISAALPGGVAEGRHFDVGDEMLGDSIYLTSNSSITGRDATFTFDAQGHVLTESNVSAYAGINDAHTIVYGGLGAVFSNLDSYPYINQAGATVQGSVQEAFAPHALGDNTSATTATYALDPYEYGLITGNGTITTSTYSLTTGRLIKGVVSGLGNTEAWTDTAYYDAAGNEQFTYRSAPSGVATNDDRAWYYDADNRLRESEERTGPVTPVTAPAEQGYDYTNETNRYDAFGRRVLVLTIRHCPNNNASLSLSCRLSTVQRFVWDGSQELDEVRQPVDTVPVTSVPTFTGENDTQPDSLTLTNNYEDFNVDFGVVLYTHGTAVDQPLSITRLNYADSPYGLSYTLYPPFTIVPFWNYRGMADEGGMSQSACVTTTRCALVLWQHEFFTYPTLARNYSSPWHGTLLTSKENATGTLYRRARVYDPVSGRFTQEDPAGLAGGMNAYGFAGGDPVNYSDPFGLCPFCPALALAGAGTLEEGVPVLGQIVGTATLIAAGGLAVYEGIQLLSDATSVGSGLDVPHGKAPIQVTPGISNVTGEYNPPDRTAPEPYSAHYDEFGRQVGRTDYTDQPDPETHTNPHHHTTEYGPGYSATGKKTGPNPGPHPLDSPKPPSPAPEGS